MVSTAINSSLHFKLKVWKGEGACGFPIHRGHLLPSGELCKLRLQHSHLLYHDSVGMVLD